MSVRCCAVIPVFDHGEPVSRVVGGLRAAGIDCLLVDDGSGPATAERLDGLAAADEGVRLLRLPANRGKGVAVVTGLREAARLGYTHALQIDADGQHDPAEAPDLIALARRYPDAVVCGVPRYDETVPRHRLISRYITHVWVWINTLSLAIRDSMCGFRLYPLAATEALLARHRIGRRMDFDTDIIVRLHWRGVAVVNTPVSVTYPADGVSHFDLWRDNLRISRMHARHFLGMLGRLPILLGRRLAGRARPDATGDH